MLRLSYYYELFRNVHPLHTAPKVLNYIEYRSLARRPQLVYKALYPADRFAVAYFAL